MYGLQSSVLVIAVSTPFHPAEVVHWNRVISDRKNVVKLNTYNQSDLSRVVCSQTCKNQPIIFEKARTAYIF